MKTSNFATAWLNGSDTFFFRNILSAGLLLTELLQQWSVFCLSLFHYSCIPQLLLLLLLYYYSYSYKEPKGRVSKGNWELNVSVCLTLCTTARSVEVKEREKKNEKW